jgi:hypothetical protein
MAVDETGETAAIRKAIQREYPSAWWVKIVGSYRQRSGLPDLLVVVEGLLFAFEVKFIRPGESRQHAVERATALQLSELRKLRAAGAVAEVVTSPAEALALIRERLTREK